MEKLKNDPNITEREIAELANEIYEWLLKHEMWIDTTIYFNGIAWSTSSKHESKDVRQDFRYNGEPFVYEDDPRYYFEYVRDPHILSMSFEGDLYDIINYGSWGLEEEFRKLFSKHKVFDPEYGECELYFELGNAWNLSVCY